MPENISGVSGREKCFSLDIPSPKTLSSLNLRDLESKFGSPFSE